MKIRITKTFHQSTDYYSRQTYLTDEIYTIEYITGAGSIYFKTVKGPYIPSSHAELLKIKLK